MKEWHSFSLIYGEFQRGAQLCLNFINCSGSLTKQPTKLLSRSGTQGVQVRESVNWFVWIIKIQCSEFQTSATYFTQQRTLKCYEQPPESSPQLCSSPEWIPEISSTIIDQLLLFLPARQTKLIQNQLERMRRFFCYMHHVIKLPLQEKVKSFRSGCPNFLGVSKLFRGVQTFGCVQTFSNRAKFGRMKALASHQSFPTFLEVNTVPAFRWGLEVELLSWDGIHAHIRSQHIKALRGSLEQRFGTVTRKQTLIQALASPKQHNLKT